MRNDPVIEEMLAPLEAENQRTAPEKVRQREIEAQEKRHRLELYDLLTAVKNCGPGVVVDRRTGECISAERFQDVMAERLLKLVKFLKETNQLGRLDRLPTDSPAPRFLRHVLLESAYSESEIAQLLRRVEPLDELAAELCSWLHGRLQDIVWADQWPLPEEDMPQGIDASQSIDPGEGDSAQEEQMPGYAKEKIRQAIRRNPSLKTGKRTQVIREARVRKQDGLAALKQLEQTGEYIGQTADDGK